MKRVLVKDIQETTTSHNAAGQKKLLIGKGVIPSLAQFAQVTFSPGEVATEHKHEDMYEVFLVEKGSGTFQINGQEYSISQGTCITIEPGELHELTNTGSEDLVLTYFGIEDAK